GLFLMCSRRAYIGRHAEARAAARRAIALNPTLSRSHANLAIERRGARPTEKQSGRPELQVAGESQLARHNRGLAFRSKGYYPEALREYGVALERGEERDLVLQAMAEIHLLMRHPKDPLAIYYALLLRQSSSTKLWNERGVSLHQDGRFTEAEESYRRALNAEPTYASARNHPGVSLYHRGAAGEASEAFPQESEGEPEVWEGRP